VKQKIREEISKIGVQEEHKQYLYGDLMDNYRKVCRPEADGSSFSIRGWPRKDGGEPVNISFSSDEASKLYDDCFAKPLANLFVAFEEAAQLSKDTVVVLSGGTFGNAHILREVVAKINEVGFEYLPWAFEGSVEGRQYVWQLRVSFDRVLSLRVLT
jgi:hypothetical protein